MRILLLHERYRQRGGEDRAFDDEAARLAAFGADVVTHVLDNRDIEGEGGIGLALGAVWSRSSRDAVRRLLRDSGADVMHVHNCFPLLSPSVYDAARAEDVPVVQTLHNFRVLCANALLMRDGRPCEACVGRRIKWPGVAHACYRDSRTASAAVAAVSGLHHAIGTWRGKVDRYIALSAFARERFIAGGLPAERIIVKPNGSADPGRTAAAWDRPRGGALFVGRLSPEKGVDPLLQAWSGLEGDLTIIGDGPMRPEPAERVHLAGRLSAAEVSRAMSGAAILTFPSICYENGPLAIYEALAHGLPVVASDLGSMRELVEPGVTGLLARPGDVEDWRDKLSWLLARPEEQRRMGANARRLYEERYTPARLVEAQMALYSDVIAERRAGHG